VRSFFSASHPKICLGTFSTVSPEILKLGIQIFIPDFKRYSLKDNFHNAILVLTKKYVISMVEVSIRRKL
jgi:hypothetical protein